MQKIKSSLQAIVFVVALVLMGLGFVGPGVAAAGDCSADCGCDGGTIGCCDLANGARCLRSPPDL